MGRERSNAGEVEFMGERERGLGGRAGAAVAFWLGRSATHILHELFSAVAAVWHGNMA